MEATAWLDRWWDEAAHLVRYPSRRASGTNPYQQPGVPLVRESAVHAVALLIRDGPGDRERAGRALRAVLAHQIDDPGAVTHGTFRRSPREPLPGRAPREWIDYDPNWREFVGAALALALEHQARIAPDTVAAMEIALRRAAEGTLARAVSADYTNIALLAAFLLDYAGERLGEPSWRAAAEALSDAVARAYQTTGALPEHNSPTYYGIDLYGLALWRSRAPSAALRTRGAAMEAALWRDLARFYHAGLRNLCGPYTRAYGMDMTRYVAGLGCWIAATVPPAQAPLPPFGDSVDHAHDFFELPMVQLLGASPPEDALAHLRAFQGSRSIRQAITPGRTTTAHLAQHVMWGGEHTSGRIVHWQHHPATLHWRRPDAGVGWLRLATTAPVDAVATPRGLEITVHTGLPWLRDAEIPVVLELELGAGQAPAARSSPWQLSGLTLDVASDPPVAWRAEAGRGARPRLGTRFRPGAAPSRLEVQMRILDAP